MFPTVHYPSPQGAVTYSIEASIPRILGRETRVRYFFNLVLGTQRLTDPEGGEYSSFAEAQAEAEKVIRDTAAEELRHGRSIPPDWRVEIADGFGNVHSTALFDGVVLSGRAGLGSATDAQKQAAGVRGGIAGQGPAHREASLVEMQALAARIRATFQDIREQLATIK